MIGSFGLYALLLWLGDPYVRHPVPDSDLTANYFLERPDTRARLTRMGYVNLTGSIWLKRDGSFEAQNIPACCVHGQDETAYPFSGGYYEMKGNWDTVVSRESKLRSIRLSIRHSLRTGGTDKVMVGGREELRTPPGKMELPLVANKPIAIAFRIFNGDFDNIIFSREGVVPVDH